MSDRQGNALLQLSAVENGYGISQVLFGVEFSIGAGECISLQGRNGMGKTTSVKSIMGIQPAWRGSILWKGSPIHAAPPHKIARQEIGRAHV